MAITLRPFSQLDPDAVLATLTETVQRIQEDNPRLELRRGIFAELLAYYHAVLDTQRRTFTNDVLNSRSLKMVEADPTLADADVVDDIMSNFLVSRKAGQVTVGEVTVVVADDITITIAKGSIWTARGKQYTTTRVYTAKAEAALLSGAGDRLLTKLSNGNWAFTIDVQAVDIGDTFSASKDTLVVPSVLPPNYVTSYASSDFTVGFSPETNAELLGRLQNGIAAKTLSNRGNMTAMLTSIEAFSRIVAMSIVGYGDAELVRAYHSILPIALGGRCDWYIRTTEQAVEQTRTATATLVEKRMDGTGIWQITYGRADAPGFYEFRNIRPTGAQPGSGGYNIVLDHRGLDMTGTGWKPDILTPIEAAYSAYSVAVIRFVDTRDHASFTVGAQQDYQISAVVMPGIGEIQATVESRDVRPYGGDVLVKAPVPAFTVVNFTIYKQTGQDDPDLAAIRTAVAKTVNTTRFSGYLYASTIQDTIHTYLLSGQHVGALDMHARIRCPDGTVRYLRDTSMLEVPNDPGNMVTSRTVQFFCSPDTVGISVATRRADA